jgi:hypothetical protein
MLGQVIMLKSIDVGGELFDTNVVLPLQVKNPSAILTFLCCNVPRGQPI